MSVEPTANMAPGLAAADVARILARWPTADHFYRARDDRTARVVGDIATHATHAVEIVVDPAAAADVTVQRIGLVAANLTARWARHVGIVLEADVPLARPLRRHGAETLGGRMLLEMQCADPFGKFTLDGSVSWPIPAVGSPLRLFVGPWSSAGDHLGPDDYQVHAVSWTALGRRGAVHTGPGEFADRPATTAAAGLAGALGAADLFKRAIHHSTDCWMPTFAWDTWSSELATGPGAWDRAKARPVPELLDLGNTLLAGVGAIGSAFVYLADLTSLSGALTLFDRDAIEITNLNRSPLFTVLHALEGPKKTVAVAKYLEGKGLRIDSQTGLWREHAAALAERPYDVWISLTNEDGSWAEVPFFLPPVVLHGTTSSGWGFGAGRHIPGREDCTLCRMPRPAAVFRGPCAEGEIARSVADHTPIRASLPFLSTAAAALVLASYMQLAEGPKAIGLPNDVSVDLGVGLPAAVALHRQPTPGCRGCRALASKSWWGWGGRGRFNGYSA